MATEKGSLAAKKAWRTRKRNATPTAAQQRVLDALAESKDVRLVSHHHEGLGCYYVSFHGRHYTVGRLRVNVVTLRIFKERGWIEQVGDKKFCGGTMGVLPNGKSGIVSRSYDIYYRLTDKGRKAKEGTLKP